MIIASDVVCDFVNTVVDLEFMEINLPILESAFRY